MTLSTKLSLVLITSLSIAFLYVFLFHKNDVDTFLRTNRLLPENEPLTELYFENHEALPQKVTIGTPQAFEFTIHNIEYKPVLYTYEIELETATQSSLLASGSATIDHDAFQSFTQEFTLTEATRSALRVTLTNLNQSIHFWMDTVLR